MPRFLPTLAVIAGALIGSLVLPFLMTVLVALLDIPIPLTGSVSAWPAPWRMPPYPGMGSLRLAMVHDVLCERFPTRSAAWHAARVADLQARLPPLPADPATARFTAEQLPLIDDLGVGLDRLGRPAEAIPWFRAKAAAQGLPWPPPPVPPAASASADAQYRLDLDAIARRGAPDPAAQQRYTTWANLGTVLVHAHLRGALAGEADARQAVADGLAALRQGVALDPAAHFGRERWQITLAEHLLAAGGDPTLLRRFDAGGAPLAEEVPAATTHRFTNALRMRWQSLMPQDGYQSLDVAVADRDASRDQRVHLRENLTTVGGDPAWIAAVAPTWRAPAAWDQPALGAVGLWTLGGGASPHLALWLATTCEAIGQHHLALEAWLRVDELAGRYSPDPATVAWLHERATAHIAALAAAARLDAAGLQWVRERFAAELAWAREQRATHDAWEAAQLAAGHPWDDPVFDTWTPATPLASPPGGADEVWVRSPGAGSLDVLCAMLLGAGLGAWYVIRRWLNT